jgi:hypothetical protein
MNRMKINAFVRALDDPLLRSLDAIHLATGMRLTDERRHAGAVRHR